MSSLPLRDALRNNRTHYYSLHLEHPSFSANPRCSVSPFHAFPPPCSLVIMDDELPTQVQSLEEQDDDLDKLSATDKRIEILSETGMRN